MRKVQIISALLLSCAGALLAVPARKDTIYHTQSDGSVVSAILRGDERCHLLTTLDGYSLEKDSKGDLVYSSASTLKAHDAALRTDAETEILSQTEKVSSFPQYYQNRISAARSAQKPMRSALQSADNEMPTTGNVKGLVVLVEFPDLKMTISEPTFKNMMNQQGFSVSNHNGSARDYFVDQSMGKFTPTFDVAGPVMMSQSYEYYGENDGDYEWNVGYMIKEALTGIKDTIDFSQYDSNNDGYIDFVYFIYAGYGESSGAGDNYIWPHSWNFSSYYEIPTITLNGKIFDLYACSSELEGKRGSTMDGIGTFCHEFSHVLGLPDLYQTDGGEDFQWDEWSILDYGCYNNDSRTPTAYSAFERSSLGWLDLTELSEPALGITLAELTQNNVAYRISTAKENEYFILENRQQVGWDAYTAAKGMMISHIDYDSYYWETNTVNNSSRHPRVQLECADSKKSYNNLEGDLFGGLYKSFTDSTSPSMKNWSNQATGKPVTSISNNGSIVSFDFMAGSVTGCTLSSQQSSGAFIQGENLIVSAPDQAMIRIYNQQGLMVASALSQGAETSFTISQPGIYFISIEGKETLKVIR